MNHVKPVSDRQSPADQRAETTVLHSHTLFAGLKEILIQHDGQQYRLQLTRSNKLILIK